MKTLSNFFSLISAVFATIPGIAVLISNIGVPPDTSKTMFAGTIEALGVLTLLILWTNKKWIQESSIKSITRLAIYSTVLFMVSLFSYLFLYGYLVIEPVNSSPVFFPLFPMGELQEGLEKMGSKYELIQEWGRDDVYKIIQSSSKTTLMLTVLLLLFIYQLIFVSLTFAFGILGIKCKEDNLQ